MRYGIRYIRLDTALDETNGKKIYLNAGFHIVDIIDHDNGPQWRCMSWTAIPQAAFPKVNL